jgi:predicted outer membrane repeat protein
MNLIRNLFASHRPETTKRARRGRHLGLESLEGRMVLSTFTVANVNDSGPGSLRQAILSADNDTGASTINFNITPIRIFGVTVKPDTIAPQSALPVLDNTAGVTIDGSGVSTGLKIDLSKSNTPDPQDSVYANKSGNGLLVSPKASATIEHLALVNASARAVEVDGTATLSKVDISHSSDGGVLNNGGTLSIVDSSVHDNTTRGNGGGVSSLRGISTLGAMLTITGSDFESNSAWKGGGAIYADGGTVTIQSDPAGNPSLVGFNTSAGGGGGLDMVNNAAVTISNARFFQDKAAFGGAIDNAGGVLTATNTMFVLNTAQYGGALYDSGSTATVLTGDDIELNTATIEGGGIYVAGSLPVHLINTFVSNNMAPWYSDIYGKVVYGS